MITFKDSSVAEFINNRAGDSGGIIVSNQDSKITFEGNTTIVFDNNTADNGGTFCVTNSTITFTDSSTVLFTNNVAQRNGGVGYFSLNSKLTFEGSSTVRFHNNIAERNAGVLYFTHSCKESSNLTLTQNTVTLNGGVFYFDSNSHAIFSQFTNLNFYSNRASNGGAILDNNHFSITLAENSMLIFSKNQAGQYGGALEYFWA